MFFQRVHDCASDSKYITCTSTHDSDYGSMIHRTLYCFIEAYYMGRKMVMNAHGYPLPSHYQMYQKFGFIWTDKCHVPVCETVQTRKTGSPYLPVIWDHWMLTWILTIEFCLIHVDSRCRGYDINAQLPYNRGCCFSLMLVMFSKEPCYLNNFVNSYHSKANIFIRLKPQT